MKTMYKLLFIFLLLPFQLCLGQERIVIAETSTKNPIVNLSVISGRNIVYTNSMGICMVSDTTKNLVISGLNFKRTNIVAPFPDTVFLSENLIELNKVVINETSYKSPKVLRSKVKSPGSFFKNTAYYMKTNLVFWNGNYSTLRLKVSLDEIKKISGEVKVKVEIRSVNHNWSDTSKALADFNDAQFAIFNKIPEKERASVGAILYTKLIPINEIETDFIDIPIESISESEVFIGIGLDSDEKTNEINRNVFRAQKFNALKMAYDYGNFNCPRGYLDAKYLVSNPETFILPYFELIIK